MNPSKPQTDRRWKSGWFHGWLLRFPSYRMHCLLQKVGHFSDPDYDAEFLPFWAAQSVIEPANFLGDSQSYTAIDETIASPAGVHRDALTVAQNRFMRRVESSAERQQEWDFATERARELNSDHVLDHFSSITGHSTSDILALAGNTSAVVRKDRTTARTRFEERPSARPSRVSPTRQKANIGKLGSRVVSSAVAVYMMLIMIGSWEPPLKVDPGYTGLPEYSWLELGSTPRGRAIPPDMYISRRYQAAVKILRRSNTSIWGYLPGFKQDLLNQGIIELEGAIQFQRNSVYMYPQALMLLANAYIRAGQPAKAVSLVDEVIERRGRRFHEAQELRLKLRRMGLY